MNAKCWNDFQTNSNDIQYTDLHAVRFLTEDLAVLFTECLNSLVLFRVYLKSTAKIIENDWMDLRIFFNMIKV